LRKPSECFPSDVRSAIQQRRFERQLFAQLLAFRVSLTPPASFPTPPSFEVCSENETASLFGLAVGDEKEQVCAQSSITAEVKYDLVIFPFAIVRVQVFAESFIRRKVKGCGFVFGVNYDRVGCLAEGTHKFRLKRTLLKFNGFARFHCHRQSPPSFVSPKCSRKIVFALTHKASSK
jgi:hypothetical protein